jgi:hypothetical protein
VAKLEAEYNIEKDMRDEDSYNQTIREYIDNSPFDVCAFYLKVGILLIQYSYMTHQVKKRLS